MAVPRRFVSRIALFAATVASCVGSVAAADSGPASLGPEVFANATQVQLTVPWRYHAGDDPSWSTVDLDDGSWERVSPRLRSDELPRGGWSGVGWFRRHLVIAPELRGGPFVIRLAAPGAARVYLDGRLVLDSGWTMASVQDERGAWETIAFSSEDHVLAVRYEFAADGSATRPDGFGFLLTLDRPGAAAARERNDRQSAVVTAIFTTIPIMLALLHLAIFWSYPRSRENLLAAFCMIALSGIVAGGWAAAQGDPGLAETVLGRLAMPSIIAAVFFGYLTYFAIRTHELPRAWKLFAMIGVVLFVTEIYATGSLAAWLWYLYFGASLVEIIRIEASGRTIRQEGSRTLLFGMVLLDAIIVVQLLINLGVIGPVAGVTNVYFIGILAIALATSLSLARDFARTRIHLERRLVEVRALSDEILTKERREHELELQGQRLETENARKTAEIESARALQLSMLPEVLPEIAGLDIAASMSTASEVGGDYYDFRVDPVGGLVVAVGDATGHGVAAGTMVTAVKALFTSIDGRESLSSILGTCDRVIGGMNMPRLHMCLAVARITPHSIDVASAAMPPVLIHRRDTDTVDEIGAGGLPLGGRLSPRWPEEGAALGPGDTILFASDGLAEQTDASGELFGYHAATEAFRDAARVSASANEVIEGLRRRVETWRGAAERSDDTTLVAIRVGG